MNRVTLRGPRSPASRRIDEVGLVRLPRPSNHRSPPADVVIKLGDPQTLASDQGQSTGIT
jgi:hypothetical protein